LESRTGSLTLLSLSPSSLSSGLACWPCPDVVYPSRSASSRQDLRADPISRSSSSQSSHPSLSGEADTVANILRHAAMLARLDPASFPTVYNASAATFPDSQLAMAPLLAQLISLVNDLGASVTFLTPQVESLTSAQAERSATPSPPATSNLEASLKDLSSRVAALSPHAAPHKWHPSNLKRHPLLPLLPKLNLLSRKRNSQPASRLVRSPPRTFPSSLRESGKATLTRTLNATRTHPKRLSSSPLAAPSQRKPNFTLSHTQLPHSSIPVPLPVSPFLIPRSPKIKPGHRLPGRAVRARKAPLQHKSLHHARVVSPKDPHRSQLPKVVSLPPVPLQPSQMILSS